MLQIASGMYFRDVPLHETTHRAMLYTNAWSVSPDPFDLPIGRFLFATATATITPVTIEVIDRLETIAPDGSKELMIATGGTELIDDAADVFSFSLNISCSRNDAVMERFVPQQLGGRPTRMPSSILRRTFDPGIVLREEDFTQCREFATKLLALRRDHFEAAIRSIRTVTDECLLVSDDPALACTLLVASLESLAQLSIPANERRSWDTYDGKKRKVFDEAIGNANLSPDQAATLREAVLEIDQLSLRRRFVDFTLAHIEPSFYRSEAADAVRPIRSTDLAHALNVAYQLRSTNVHTLQALAPELWAITDRADTLHWEGRPVLSLEGLNRLCRHVIRTFVNRGPTDLDETFDYRRHLPGIVRMPLAPQYWIWQAEIYSPDTAPQVLEGFIQTFVATLADPDNPQIPDLSAVLEKIEAALPDTASVAQRRPMVATYLLWHAIMSPDHHRPEATATLERYEADLHGPNQVGFAVRVLLRQNIEWVLSDQLELIKQRRDDLQRGRGQPLPPRFDAALLLATATRCWNEDRVDDGIALISEAVEVLPGETQLIAIENEARQGKQPDLDLFDFVVGLRAPEQESVTAQVQVPSTPMGEVDPVDEWISGSFPASDPPQSWTWDPPSRPRIE